MKYWKVCSIIQAFHTIKELTYLYFAEDLNGRADVQTEGAKSESRKFQRFKLCVSH